MTLEVGNLPGDADVHAQCVHLHVGEDLKASIFRIDDVLMIRPEADMTVTGAQFANGEKGYIVRSLNEAAGS